MVPAFSIIKTAKSIAPAGLPAGLLICLLLASPVGLGQTSGETQRPEKTAGDQDQSDVLRVYTELVQTDVMVFDKQGRFVDGLKPENFELRIDGKPAPIKFFELITAGSISEEAQIAAARGSVSSPPNASTAAPAPLDRGRPIFFYVDDMHLDLPGLTATRKLITRFIDAEMGQNDEAAIASASGQIGFLQQLTDNKAVLHAALERLKFRPYSVTDRERPAMTEYQGLLITNYNRDVLDFFIEATIRFNPGISRETAEAMVTARATVLAQQAGNITLRTLAGLEGLIRSANKLPGRKLVFFISGGFFVDDRNSDSRTRLRKIVSAAARSGVVIYSMDARGLVASLNDISSPSEIDLSGRLERANSGELTASQDGLNALAADTGGKAVFNTNSLEPALGRALRETLTYYLLAWQPEHESRSSKFRRLEVKVVGRPELTVQVRRGFFDREPETAKSAREEKAAARQEKEGGKSPEAELRKVLSAPYPERDLPLSLSLNYLNIPARGLLLSTVVQVPNEFLSFVPTNGKPTATVTFAGVVLDEKGNAGSEFTDRLTIAAPSTEATKDGRELTYNYPVYVKPGLYQVRILVHDETTGRSGAAYEWIEVPNLSSGQLGLSSLLLGYRPPAATAASTPGNPDDLARTVKLNVSHNFPRNGHLRFMIIAYNAARAAGADPDLAVQIQVVRDEQPVTTTALRKLSVESISDLTRIPYAAELSLQGLPPGRYVLQVTVVDRVTKKSASQQSRFQIQ